MRKEIYEAVAERLLAVVDIHTGEAVLSSVDLWRGPVSTAGALLQDGQTTAYVEFLPSEWKPAGTMVSVCEVKFVLHVTDSGLNTDASKAEQRAASLRLMDKAEVLAHSLDGWAISGLGRVQRQETAAVHTSAGVCECLEALCCVVRVVV